MKQKSWHDDSSLVCQVVGDLMVYGLRMEETGNQKHKNRVLVM